MALRPLTDDERAAAREKATQARTARADVKKGLRERLLNVVNTPFQKLTYTEAIDLLLEPAHVSGRGAARRGAADLARAPYVTRFADCFRVTLPRYIEATSVAT
jgi:hypothetical protein